MVPAWNSTDVDYGQCAVPQGQIWTEIIVGTYHSCGLTFRGKKHCWGCTLNASKQFHSRVRNYLAVANSLLSQARQSSQGSVSHAIYAVQVCRLHRRYNVLWRIFCVATHRSVGESRDVTLVGLCNLKTATIIMFDGVLCSLKQSWAPDSEQSEPARRAFIISTIFLFAARCLQ